MKSSGGMPGPDRGSGREQTALRSYRGLLYTLQLLGEILYYSHHLCIRMVFSPCDLLILKIFLFTLQLLGEILNQ